MNILDENTKAMLDAGNVAVLDGGYIVMAPETLMQAVQNATLGTQDDIIMGQTATEEANNNFMNQAYRCHFCGKESRFGTEYTLTIGGGYASDHDMERVSVNVCGLCLERMLATVS